MRPHPTLLPSIPWGFALRGSDSNSHVEGVITVGEVGNTLVMAFPTTGTTQEWIRVDASDNKPVKSDRLSATRMLG